jgi:hypothetical protein
MDIIDKYNYKRLKLKDYIFELHISEAFKSEFFIEVHFTKVPTVITPDIFVQILKKLKPSLNEFNKVAIIEAKYNTLALFKLLGLESITRFRTLPIDDEIKRFQDLEGKQIDLSEPKRIAALREKKVIRTLEFLKRKHTRANDFEVSLSYEIYSRVQNNLSPALYVTIIIKYYGPAFRSEHREEFNKFKDQIRDELIEFSPIEFKTYDSITILSQPIPLKQ